MTEGERRVVALAVALAKQRAPALMGRLPADAAADAVHLASRLAAAPRSERLQALAGACSTDDAIARAGVEAAAALERPRVAGLLGALGSGASPTPQCSPMLVRLCRERIGR